MAPTGYITSVYRQKTIDWLRTIQADGLTALVPGPKLYSPLQKLNGEPVLIRAAFPPRRLIFCPEDFRDTGLQIRRGFPPSIPKYEENGDDIGRIDPVATSDVQTKVQRILGRRITEFANMNGDEVNAYHLFDLTQDEESGYSIRHVRVHLMYFTI